MQAEIEVRFLSVDYDALRQKMQRGDGKQIHPMRLMKRVIIDYPDQRLQRDPSETWAFVRLRDEGDRTLLTYKQIAKNDNRDTHEWEVEVGSFDTMLAIFEKIGLQVISEQHTRREVWHFMGCDVSLDDWPWLPPMVEIEGPDEATLQAAAKALGLQWDELIRGNSVDAYKKMYPGMKEGESIRDIAKLTFEEMPDWLKIRQKP